MCLNNLVDDRKPQTGASFKTRLQRLENLGFALGVESDASITESDTQPKRPFFKVYGQGTALRHGAKGVVAEIPEHLADLVRVDARADRLAVEGADDLIFRTDLRFLFHQDECFVEQSTDVCFSEFVGLDARVVQEIGDDVIEALGLPSNDPNEMPFVLLKRHQTSQLLDGAGYGRERLTNLVSDGRR